MPAVRPFRALRPPAPLAARVAAPPYDVVNTAEARALADGNPDSFLHVSRPEIDLPVGIDEHADEVYEQGRTALADFIARAVLVPDPKAHYFVYRQVMGSIVQTGIVGLVDVDDYAASRIKKHEFTRPDKEDDRTRHIDVLDAHDEPVFLLHARNDEVATVVSAVVAEEPEVDFIAADGIGHTLWVVDDDDRIATLMSAFEAIPALYVADGHHRSAAAARLRDLRRERGDLTDGAEHFLAVVFAEDELNIMAYNRVVADLNGRTPEQFLADLESVADYEAADAAVVPVVGHELGVYLAGAWYRARFRADLIDESDPKARLDVSVLQDRVLGPILGIADPRTDRRIAFIGGIRGTAELERLVDDGEAAVAFSMCPTSLRDLMALADRDDVMPPKSTWFEPKLRSGLFLHVID